MVDYQHLLKKFYETFLRNGDVAIDAGAHTGCATIPVIRAVSPDCTVHAFELLPGARRQLDEAVSGRYPAVSVYPYALADHDGDDEFVIAVDVPEYSGLKQRIYDGPTRIERIFVPVRTLDAILLDAPLVDYISVDADGAELGILRGAAGLLARTRPIVGFEFGANSLTEYRISIRDIAEFWANRPYAICAILGRRLDTARFCESANRQQVCDYVASPLEREGGIISAWGGAE